MPWLQARMLELSTNKGASYVDENVLGCCNLFSRVWKLH